MISVLVVDDDFMVARIHQAFVDQTPGFRTVATANDGAAAIRSAGEHQPELILLDIYLPDRSGLDLLPDLRSAAPDADVMIISAAREANTIRTTVRQGVVDYLLKPFAQQMLMERLGTYARRRQRLQDVQVNGQDDVDRALGGAGEVAQRMPKGLSTETAQSVIAALQHAAGSLSATEAGGLVGISRVSARRYLEWLVEAGHAEVSLRYGSQGRPERRFRYRR
ncbi:response regulator [Naumannella huperziae]